MLDTTTPLNVFVSFSPSDEVLRKRLEVHLSLMVRQGLINPWHEGRVEVGKEWAVETTNQLDSAQVILLLVSADYLAGPSHWREMDRALKRHSTGEARVVPIILSPCDWETAPFGDLRPTPSNRRPITTWSNPEEAWADVARDIRTLHDSIKSNSIATSSAHSLTPIHGSRVAPPPRRRIDGISEDAQRIVDEIEVNSWHWEMRLLSQVLADEIKSASLIKRELTSGVTFGPYKYLDDGEALTWIRWQMDEMASIGSGMTHLINEELRSAIGPPGLPGDPEAIAFVAMRIGAAYKRSIDWTIQWRKIRTNECFDGIVGLGPRWTANFIPQIEEWCALVQRKVAEFVASPRDLSSSVVVDLSFTISVPEGVQDQFNDELKKIRAVLRF